MAGCLRAAPACPPASAGGPAVCPGRATPRTPHRTPLAPGLAPRPSLQRQAETLNAGIKAICYDLNAPREEVLRLIMENKSVLHGQQMHLSVADIAHLAMSREPVRRVVD